MQLIDRKKYVIHTHACTQQKLEGAESDIKYVRTLEGEPSPPRDLTATPLNFSAVKINWLPPKQPNGEIKYYEIEIEPIEINKKRILMKNSCDFTDDIPEDFDDSGVEKAKKTQQGQPNGPGGPNSQGECDCSSCPAPGAKGGPIDKNSQLDEVTFIDDIMNRVHQLDQDQVCSIDRYTIVWFEFFVSPTQILVDFWCRNSGVPNYCIPI